MSPNGRPESEYRRASHEGFLMTANREYRRA